MSRRSLLACGLLVIFAYLPSLVSYSMNLWAREHYQFFPLAVVGAVFFARRVLKNQATVYAPSGKLAVALAVVAVAIFAVSAIFWSPLLGYVSFLVLLTALLAGWGGWPLLRAMAPALVMLAILIRPPMNLDKTLALWLRDVAVTFSSAALEVTRVPHFLSGVVIEIPWERLLVEEACSGINSTFFVFAFALFHGLSKRRPAWHIALITLAGVSFVILGNVGRITLGATLRYRYGWDLLHGWKHETFGLVLFVAYIGLIASVDFLIIRLLKGKMPEVEEPEGSRSARLALRSLVQQATKGFNAAAVIAVAVMLAGLGVNQAFFAWHQLNKTAIFKPTYLRPDAWFSLPDQIGEWQNMGSRRPMGMQNYLQIGAVNSQVWAYKKERLQCLVALSYPYYGQHNLYDCYNGQGWNQLEPIYLADPSSPRKTIIEIQMSRKPVSHGYLLYGAFDEEGQRQEVGLVENRFNVRPLVVEEIKTTYQVQLFTVTYAPLTAAEKQECMGLFLEAQKQLKKQVLDQLIVPRAGKGGAQ